MKLPPLCFAVLLPAFFSPLLLAGEKIFLIEDPFGVDHGPQAVVFTETFPQPGVPLGSLGADVDGQPAFFQRRALSAYPDGTVREGEWTLWLHLAAGDKKNPPPPGSRPRFNVRLHWGGGQITPQSFPASPITISREAPYLIVDTGAAQFRIPDNRVIPAPGGPQGPIAGFRTAGDANWYGGGAFIEGHQIASVRTDISADGPARAIIRVSFSDPEETSWTSELTFTAGSPVVQIHDTMDLQGAWVIDLSNDLSPDTQFACPWFDWESPTQRGAPSEKPLRPWHPGEIRGGDWPDLNEFFRLDPKWHDYQYMKGPYAWYYNKAERGSKKTAFAMFAWNMTRWHPTNASRPRVFVQGGGKGALRIRVPLTGGPHTRTLESADPDDPVPRVIRVSTAERSWGIAAFPAPDIRGPESFLAEAEAEARAALEKTVRSQIEREKKDLIKRAEAALRQAASAGGPAKITQQAVAAKMRELGWPDQTDDELAAARLASLSGPSEAEIRRLAAKKAADSAAAARALSLQTLVRFAHLPVTKIKDWVFTWPDADRNMDRGIFRGLDELAALQAEIREGKSPAARAVLEHIAAMRETLVTTTDSKGNTVETVDKQFGKDWDTARAIERGDVRAGPVFIFTPGGGFRPDAKWIYQSSYTEGTLNPTTAPRGIRANIWDQSMNFLWKKEGRAEANRNMAAMAYIFSDPDFWNGRYYDWGIGNPNFHTDMHNIPGMVAAQLRTHPHAQKWAAYSRREIRADVARSSWQPGGGWTESPGYTAHAFSVFLPTAHAFRRAGLADPFSDPVFKDALSFILNLLTPPDKRSGVRGQITIGDSQTPVRVENLLQAALAYEHTDPAFASDLMAAARASAPGGRLIRPAALGNTLTSSNLNIPANPGWTLQSRYYGGVGAFLRSRFGRPDESLVTFKAGPARNHYQGDELSFTFWGCGDYLAVDYASFYSPRMNPDWTHNKVSFGLAASSPPARMMAFETTPAADLAVAENVNDTLQFMTRPYASARSLWDYPPLPVAPRLHRRLILFVKHPDASPFADYLVIRDELSGGVRDQPNPALLRPRLEIVLRENLEAVVRDASWAPSAAEELLAELETHLRMLGAAPADAAALTAAARDAIRPGRTTPFSLDESPALAAAMSAALDRLRPDLEPRSNLHLLALDNPARSADRLDFQGQLGAGVSLYVATGQNAAAADINWFGWGHSQRPADFIRIPPDDRGREQWLPYMGGQWHSHRHGPVIGRDASPAASPRPGLPVWTFGEMAQWVSLPFQGRDDMTIVLYPVAPGAPAPSFSSSDGGRSLTIRARGAEETLTLASDRPVTLTRDGQQITIAASLPPPGAPQPPALTPRRAIEGGFDKTDDRPGAAGL